MGKYVHVRYYYYTQSRKLLKTFYITTGGGGGGKKKGISTTLRKLNFAGRQGKKFFFISRYIIFIPEVEKTGVVNIEN